MNSGGPHKVCHLRATNFFGGPEKQILEHCLCLDASRWAGVVATFREGRNAVELDTRARDGGLETFQIETRSSFSPGAISLLRSELATRGIDVLVTHGYKSDLVGLFAGWGRTIPHFVHMRGFTGEDWKVKLYERLDLAVLRHVPGVICVSEGTRRLLIDRGVDASRAHTVHNAVHVTKEFSTVDLHDAFGIPDGARVLVAAGRLSPEKGHGILIDAFSRLAEKHGDLQLLILGDGPLAATLAHQAAHLPGSKRVHLAGFRRDVLGCLAASTLVVNPSYTEGLPNVVLEAFVAETPVIATAVGGVPELIEDSRTGLLVPSGDAEALAGAIEHALGDPPAARAMADAARQLVEREFTFEAQADRLMALYDGARPR